MIITYRPLTQAEFEEVKVEVKKVVAGLSFSNNHNNGIRISPTKKIDYNIKFEDAEKILTVLGGLGMYTSPMKQELEIMRGASHGLVSNQIFSMIHKLA